MPDAIVPKETQQKWLLEICEKLVEKYILPSTENFLCIVEQAQELQEGCNEIVQHGQNQNKVVGERDEYGYYYCLAGCSYVFSTKAIRKR